MQTPTEEAEIRKGLDDLVQALRAKDIEALMAHYAAATVVFDIRRRSGLRAPMPIERTSRRGLPRLTVRLIMKCTSCSSQSETTWHSAIVCATSEAKERTGRKPTIGCV
ncbi:hypothetical protein MES4922_210263 [Mesorhizobium ventifaucium]|uniref:SnoaL-like domain-containing protein n=1 Tax=Mesorhizobium ventifaucium TaxID=666020 RepID=A0ABM9DRW2_9HYPH|nr:hypothetical protein MES4922_210263 [Mesorhizobium ventifaucium]